MNTVRILGSRAREQVPGTGITLHAPGFHGSLAQVAADASLTTGHELPIDEAAAGADVHLAARLVLELDARADGAARLRARSAAVGHPRLIVPRRPRVVCALLQTDEQGVSSFVLPCAGDDTESVFALDVAVQGHTRRELRLLLWPELPVPGPGPLAVISRWERLRRPYQLLQRDARAHWRSWDREALASGPALLLLHDSFATPQSGFAEWLESEAFARIAGQYQGRCLGFQHPTLSMNLRDNAAWLLDELGPSTGPFDVVAHGRGGLLARVLAEDGRWRLRRICQLGTPNLGTALARPWRLPRLLDGHIAGLAARPKVAAVPTLEGALMVLRGLAQRLRVGLPGIDELTPEAVPRDEHARGDTRWYTVGAQYMPARESVCGVVAPEAAGDLVVPAQGCHQPGFPVADSLRLRGDLTHHHNYLADSAVRDRLTTWLAPEL